jgi:hypothetical protein
MLIANGETYTLQADRDPQRPGDYQVRIISHRHETLLTVVGPGDELHALFLGLHNVLIDAGRDGGRADQIIPHRAEPDVEAAEG